MLGPKSTNEIENGSGNQQAGGDIHGISAADHERMLQTALADLRADLEAKHSEAHRANDAVHQLAVHKLQTQITENERRLADPQVAYQEYQARNAELEQLLEDATTDIGENRIKDAQISMDAGDYSKADDIFAEVEKLEDNAVKRASKAAYGRGLVAEEQVRWADAAAHYSKAARLDPTYVALDKAGTFLWRSGQYDRAIKIQEDLVALSRQTYGEIHENTAGALNDLANSVRAAGNLQAAEPLFRQALEIGVKTIGTDHPDYAIHLNNLASLLQAMGDYSAAEPLFRQAHEIDAKTIGTDHPNYAIHLNNLASLLQAMGDYSAAEPLYRQAVTVMEAALGADHPSSMILRNNLEKFLREKP